MPNGYTGIHPCYRSWGLPEAGKRRTRRNGRKNGHLLVTEHRKESMIMEENNQKDTQEEDPTPLTDEEFARFQKKQKRDVSIIGTIIEFILGFFH